MSTAGGNGHRITVIGQDDDVETAMKANLLEAVHQLTDDPVYALQGQNQLQETGTQSTLGLSLAARHCTVVVERHGPTSAGSLDFSYSCQARVKHAVKTLESEFNRDISNGGHSHSLLVSLLSQTKPDRWNFLQRPWTKNINRSARNLMTPTRNLALIRR